MLIVLQREIREAEILASQAQEMRNEALQLANTWMVVKHDMEAAKQVGGVFCATQASSTIHAFVMSSLRRSK